MLLSELRAETTPLADYKVLLAQPHAENPYRRGDMRCLLSLFFHSLCVVHVSSVLTELQEHQDHQYLREHV